MSVGWSSDFVVLEGDQSAAAGLARAEASLAAWALVRRESGRYWYVFSLRELHASESLVAMRAQHRALDTVSLQDALDLHEYDMSTPVTSRDEAERTAPPAAMRTATAARFVEIAPDGTPTSVGGADVGQRSARRGLRPTSAPRPASRRPQPLPAASEPRAPASREEQQQQQQQVPERAQPQPVPADEGTTPIRFPSIEPAGVVQPGAPITLVVDLRQRESPSTRGGSLSIAEQPIDWTSIGLDVTLLSPAITFDDGGRGTVTIRRNARSVAATMHGVIHDDVVPGSEIEVTGQFWSGTRFSGIAVRTLAVADRISSAAHVAAHAASVPVAAAAAPAATTGSIQVDRTAVAPDLTVYVSLIDPSVPGRLHWRMVAASSVDTLPPKLDGTINLGNAPATEAAAMFRQLATLERGKHQRAIEGLGERLWQRAPIEFRQVYWALHDHLQRTLTIQFISDDPHMPWELMAPFRDGEQHEPLALRHAVARWISRFAGLMRNGLPTGQLVTVAPRYKRANLRLSQAETTADALTAEFGAHAVPGTLDGMLELLEQPPAPPLQPVSLLYFTGHGAFSADDAAASVIKLEDGQLTVDDVARQRVTLGEACGTVVFFNACEVGATAAVLGTVGGWADAFLSRRFSAFIAPLWAIDEEDASVVTRELMTRIVTNQQPLGEALRDVRRAHGAVSPTFYSYLLYGDVTAHLPAPTHA